MASRTAIAAEPMVFSKSPSVRVNWPSLSLMFELRPSGFRNKPETDSFNFFIHRVMCLFFSSFILPFILSGLNGGKVPPGTFIARVADQCSFRTSSGLINRQRDAPC